MKQQIKLKKIEKKKKEIERKKPKPIYINLQKTLIQLF